MLIMQFLTVCDSTCSDLFHPCLEGRSDMWNVLESGKLNQFVLKAAETGLPVSSASTSTGDSKCDPTAQKYPDVQEGGGESHESA